MLLNLVSNLLSKSADIAFGVFTSVISDPRNLNGLSMTELIAHLSCEYFAVRKKLTLVVFHFGWIVIYIWMVLEPTSLSLSYFAHLTGVFDAVLCFAI